MRAHKPVRHRTYWQKVGALVKPERAAAVLLVLGGWVENRRHTDEAAETASSGEHLMFQRATLLSLRADSLTARVLSLERQLKRLRGGPGASAEDWQGPRGPEKRGTLLHSLFGWLTG